MEEENEIGGEKAPEKEDEKDEREKPERRRRRRIRGIILRKRLRKRK